jgi:hypothetical protein
VLASEAPLVAFAVLRNVQRMRPLKLLAVLHDHVVAAWRSAGGLGAVVGVAASTVPVSGDGLGVQRHVHVEHLPDAVQDVPAHSETPIRSPQHAAGALTKRGEGTSGVGCITGHVLQHFAALEPAKVALQPFLGAVNTGNQTSGCGAAERAPGHPQLVSHGNALAGAHLVLPLGSHHLSIDA